MTVAGRAPGRARTELGGDRTTRERSPAAREHPSDQDWLGRPLVRVRVAVEAGIAQGWDKFTGTDGEVVSLEHFGASADYQTLYREFGLTDEAVVAAAKRPLARLEA